jgi:arylsulfatase A-like enzyme
MNLRRARIARFVSNGIALLALFGCSPPVLAAARAAPASRRGAPTAPSLLLVTVDTWRWDYIGASGAGKVETPNLDALAKGGVYEPEAMTSCPMTTPAHASILTGMNPMHHGILDCTLYRLNPSVPTLAEAFGAAGYATAAFVSSETLRARFGLGRGFGVYDESGMTRRGREDSDASSRDGQVVTKAFLDYLPSLAPGQRAFVWVHYFDLHLPYRPRPAFDRRYPRDPYAAQAAFVDGEIGKVVASLETDRGRSWRIVVVGDHGEGLGERGEDTHGIGLYRGTLHVPMVLFPKPEAPLQLPKPWGLVDLAPTLREWFGLSAADGSDGMSLFQKERPGRSLLAVSVEPSLLFAVEPSLGVRAGAFLYLRGGGESLYDLEADPAEGSDLARIPERRRDLGRLRTLCDRSWPSGWLEEALPPSLKPSEENLKKLMSLGYLSGSAPAGGKVQRTDIREVMADKSEWDRGRDLAFRTGKDDELLAIYSRLVTKYPDSLALRNWYAPLLARTGRYQEAIAVLEPAARLYPQSGTTLLNIGTTYSAMGEFEKARKSLEEAREREPGNALIYKELGSLHADHIGNPEKAIAYFKKFLALGGRDDEKKIQTYVRTHEPNLKKSP